MNYMAAHHRNLLPGISNTGWLEFCFNQPVQFYSPATFPTARQLPGRWLGVAHRVGQELCHLTLPGSGVLITRSTVQPISIGDLSTKAVIDELTSYNMKIAECFAKRNKK